MDLEVCAFLTLALEGLANPERCLKCNKKGKSSSHWTHKPFKVFENM